MGRLDRWENGLSRSQVFRGGELRVRVSDPSVYSVHGWRADGTPLTLEDAQAPLVPDEYVSTRALAAGLQAAFPGTIIVIDYVGADEVGGPEPLLLSR